MLSGLFARLDTIEPGEPLWTGYSIVEVERVYPTGSSSPAAAPPSLPAHTTRNWLATGW